MADGTLSAIVRQRYAAPRETVFRAFSEPGLIPRWLSPSDDFTNEVVAFDFRVGGKYRFRYTHPDGTKDFVTGEYREISAPERLVFTWTWEEPDPHAGIDTLVTIEFIGHADGTEIALRHERFPDRETRDRHDAGWNGAFERLRRALAGIAGNRFHTNESDMK